LAEPQQRPPHRPNGFGAEEMLGEMAAAGVDRAVIVPPTWAGDSNEWALEIAARYPKRFAVVGRFDVRAPDGNSTDGSSSPICSASACRST